jgi:hypothetical protein
MRSVPSCYKQDKLVVRQLLDIKDVNTGDAGSMALEAVTKQRLVKTQQTEKT